MTIVTRSQTKPTRQDLESEQVKIKIRNTIRNFVDQHIKQPIDNVDYFDYCNLLQSCKQASFEYIRATHLQQCSKFQLQTIERILDYMIANKSYYDYKNYTLTNEELHGAIYLNDYVNYLILTFNYRQLNAFSNT